MAVYLSPIGGAGAQFFDNNGNPLSGGKLYTYAAGTTTNQVTYTNNAGTIPHTNPIILDSAGRVPSGEIWLTEEISYKFLIKTASNVLLGTYDNITGIGDPAALMAYEAQIAAPSGSSLVGFLQAGASAVARTVQSKLRDCVSVKDFGAVGDGVTDDTLQVQAAINHVASIGGGEVYFPPGSYRTTQTITISTPGVSLFGASGGPSILSSAVFGDHFSGPVIWVKVGQTKIFDLNIDASSTRQAAPMGLNIGLLVEPEDTLGLLLPDCTFMRMVVRRQPSHGLVFGAGIRRTVVEQIYSRDHGGHAFAVSSGTLTNRVNKNVSGMIDFRTCSSESSGGHALAIGEPNETFRPFRVMCRSFEASDCAKNPAVRYTDHQIYVRADNIEINNSATRGIQGGGNFSGGIFAGGRNVYLINNRYVDCVMCVELSDESSAYNARNIVVDGLRVFNDVRGVDQTYAVIAPPNSRLLRVVSDTPFGYTNLVDNQSGFVDAIDNNNKTWDGNLVGLAKMQSTRFVSDEAKTIANNAVTIFNVGQLLGGIVALAGNVSSIPSALIWVRVGPTPEISIISSISGGNLDVTTGVLTGTTGVVGKLTVSCDSSSNIYVENRLGSARTYSLTVLGGL